MYHFLKIATISEQSARWLDRLEEAGAENRIPFRGHHKRFHDPFRETELMRIFPGFDVTNHICRLT